MHASRKANGRLLGYLLYVRVAMTKSKGVSDSTNNLPVTLNQPIYTIRNPSVS